MQWLRLYHDTVTDEKWRVVANECGQPVGNVLAVWMSMLINASNSSVRGTLEGWHDRYVAGNLGYPVDTVRAIRDAMQGIVLDGDVLTGWDRRQRVSDDAAEAKRKQREKVRQNPPDGGGNGGVGTDQDKPRRNGHVSGHSANVHGQKTNVPGQTVNVQGLSMECPEIPLDLSYLPSSPTTLIKTGGGDAGAREAAQRVAELTGLAAGGRNLRTVERWLVSGYDPDRDIFPAVVAVVSSAKEPIGSFEYFSKAIGRLHAERIAPPVPAAAASNVTQIRRPAGPAGGRPIEAGAAEFLALLARKTAEMS